MNNIIAFVPFPNACTRVRGKTRGQRPRQPMLILRRKRVNHHDDHLSCRSVDVLYQHSTTTAHVVDLTFNVSICDDGEGPT
jgi:hypothetical protein